MQTFRTIFKETYFSLWEKDFLTDYARGILVGRLQMAAEHNLISFSECERVTQAMKENKSFELDS